MRAILKKIFILASIFPITLWADQPPICGEFRSLGWPGSVQLSQYALHNTLELGAREDSNHHFYNIDIDGDDIEDEITLGCSASTIPADPCVMEAKLSSGDTIEFEAWHLFLVRHRGQIYAVTANEESKSNKIYRVGPKIMQLVCDIQ